MDLITEKRKGKDIPVHNKVEEHMSPTSSPKWKQSFNTPTHLEVA